MPLNPMSSCSCVTRNIPSNEDALWTEYINENTSWPRTVPNLMRVTVGKMAEYEPSHIMLNATTTR